MDQQEDLEALQSRHRKEQRDLQARVTQKKKSATKKTRKGVNDECAALEVELKERQTRELAGLNGENTEINPNEMDVHEAHYDEAQDTSGENTSGENANGIQSSMKNLSISSPPSKPTDPPTSNGIRKTLNRAKTRLARRAAEQDALARKAAEEAASLPNLREQERARMREHFAKYGLQEKEIKADGHCLYAAVADQMDQAGLGLKPRITPTIITEKKLEGSNDTEQDLPGYKAVRHAAADFIERNPDDFEPFLEEPLPFYVHRIRETGEWGGHMELAALAKTYGVKIHVLHGDGRMDKIEPGEDAGARGDEEKVIWLGYYRHGFGLGEHYNSLRKAP